jgi:hypothetical protein
MRHPETTVMVVMVVMVVTVVMVTTPRSAHLLRQA